MAVCAWSFAILANSLFIVCGHVCVSRYNLHMHKKVLALIAALCPVISWGLGGVWAQAEQLSGIPKEKIYAVALKESGMTHKDKLFRPWPWTINSPRGARRFASKQEAYAEIKDLIANGISNVDIGVMQINLYWHWNSIKDLDVLDPTTNVLIAAQLLRDEMKKSNGNIPLSVARYHTRDSIAGADYQKSVFGLEETIINQLGKSK